jgi:dienelactone hydrolase
MSKLPAKLPKEAQDFLEAHPEIESVDAIFADLSGILRGKRYPVGYLGKLYGGEVAMPASARLPRGPLSNAGTGFSGTTPSEQPASTEVSPVDLLGAAQVLGRPAGDDAALR